MASAPAAAMTIDKADPTIPVVSDSMGRKITFEKEKAPRSCRQTDEAQGRKASKIR